MRKILLFFFFILSQHLVFSQDSTDVYKQIRFIKFNQANDLFTVFFQSDKYYTDGVDMELALPIFNNKVADIVLLGFKNTPYKDFSLSFNQDMYTPENTQITTVDSSDRPYAGQMYLTYSKYSNQFIKGRKITTSLYLGVQGPAAMAGKSQNWVHHIIDNDSVLGWDNQLSNGLIIDYIVQYMALIPISTSITELHYFGNIHLGTLNSSTQAGIRFKIGHYTDSYMNFYGISNLLNDYHFTASDIAKMTQNRRKLIPKRIRQKSLKEQAKYLNEKLNRKFQFYFFSEATVNYILRDGSVEGSLIQFQDNIYEFNYDDYKHTKLLGRYGLVLQYKHFYMEYARYLENDTYQKNGVFGYGKIIISVVF
jgi:hypothetical protein